MSGQLSKWCCFSSESVWKIAAPEVPLDGRDMQLSSWPLALIKNPWMVLLSADHIPFPRFSTVSFILLAAALCPPYFQFSVGSSCQPCLTCVLKHFSFYEGSEVTVFAEWAKWFLYMGLGQDFYFLTKSTTTIANYSVSNLQQQPFMACQHCIESQQAVEVEHRKGTCSKLAPALATFECVHTVTAETSGLRCKPDGYHPSSGVFGDNRGYSSNLISDLRSYFLFPFLRRFA